MTYSGSQWTVEFTAKNTTEHFKLHLNNSGDHWYGYDAGTVSANSSSWSELWTNSNTGKFSFTNLVVGTTYKVTLQGNSGKDSCNVKIEAVAEEAPDALYMYKTTGPNQIASATNDGSDVFTFEVELDNGDYFVLSKNSGATSWDGIQANSGRYNCSSDTNLYDGTTSSFTQTNSGAWKAAVSGTNTYIITVDWSAKTLTAEIKEDEVVPETMYLFAGSDQVGSAAVSGETYTYYSVALNAGDQIVLSSDASAAAGTKYTPGAATTIVDSESTTFELTDNGYWEAPVYGTYDITVDWTNKTFTATIAYPTLYVYSSADWANYIASAEYSGYTEGYYDFYDMSFAAGEQIVLSTSSTGIVSGEKFTPGAETTLVEGKDMSFSKTDAGYWVAPDDATDYAISVDWANLTMTASWTEPAPTDMYLFVNGANPVLYTSEDGLYYYTVDLTAGDQLTLSSDATAASGTIYTPGEAVDLFPERQLNMMKSDTGYWRAPATGTYEIRVEWSAEYIVATWTSAETLPTLYLYSNTPSWSTKVGTANSTNGLYTFILNIGSGEKFVLSTKNAKGVDYNGLKNEIYTQGSGESTLSNGATVSFSNTNDGCWVAPASGKYTITVDWNNNKLTATWTEIQKKIHMPLTSSDFENGKKHYFLVGNRMGEWRLLPEWEFQVEASTGNLVLKNRWIYPGGFAIGVVDSYADYLVHKYTYYCQAMAFTDDVLTSGDISGTGTAMSFSAGSTVSSPANNFWSDFSADLGGGDSDYWGATGTLVNEIRVTLNNEKPSVVSMTVGSKADANKNRFFTLVGDYIYNQNYCNSFGPGETLMKTKVQNSGNGWQEGWIQYDPKTGEPYVDGNYNYLYHTSYTPDYFQTNPAYFNQMLADGSTFSYSSKEAQFVEYSQLSNLDSDPYKVFYTAFTDPEGNVVSIADGVEKHDEGNYNFIVNTENGDVTPSTGHDWSCYVVRDMWVDGEIKIWTGWGGNDRKSSGKSDANGATWHGENGGPATAGLLVQGYDINSGLTVTLYNNEKNIDNTNYKVSEGGDPVYFNRVILWYNIDEGIENSFVQFIQESAGPAIFAQVTGNGNLENPKDNYIKYNWYLNAPQNTADKDRVVVGYEIIRYRVIDGVKNNIGYPEDGYVSLADIGYPDGLTVAQLQKGHTYDFATFVDGGIDGSNGFEPGLYQYDIYVTFDEENGPKKLATSNVVAIYDENIVSPTAMALQLVKLTEEGKTTLGTAVGTTITQDYLTYNPNEGGKWFVLNVDVTEEVTDDETTITRGTPRDGMTVDGVKALDFLVNHQDKNEWTSNFYVSCIDADYYKSTLEEYKHQGLIQYETLPEPSFYLMDGYGYEGEVGLFTLDDKEYYAGVIMRKGCLTQLDANVDMTYSYTDVDGNGVSENPSTKAPMIPVMPKPYGATYSYVVKTVTEDVGSATEYVTVNVPTRGSSAFEASTSTTEVNIKVTDGVVTANSLALVVKYNRPNVDAEIRATYHGDHTVVMAAGNDWSTDFWYWDYFESESTLNTVELLGVAPYNSWIPSVEFVGTRYLTKEDNGWGDGPNGTIGHGISFNAPHTFTSEAGDGLSGVHLGKIVREDGTWDWMYKGHESFGDVAPQLVPSGETAEAGQETIDIAPNYYLYELAAGTDATVYEFLVSHPTCDHRTGDVTVDESTGLIQNDTDPLIATYVAKGFETDETPTVYASSIYLFSEDHTVYVNGKLPDSNDGTTEEEVPEEGTEEEVIEPTALRAPSKEDLVDGDQGGLPDTGTEVIYSAPFNGWAVLAQTYSTMPSDDNVTGVEDVLAEGESGEVVYYNLQGIRVENPSAGVYIRVQGKNVNKVVIK